MNNIKNNVVLVGTVVTEKEFSHETYGEKFYKTKLAIKRISGTLDMIPLIISERLCDVDEIRPNTRIKISGDLRSYNQYNEDDDKTHLILSVFASDIAINIDEPLDANEIILHGYICKRPIYRQTPQGREITDILLAVNRSYGKSDYLPCITWGRNALGASRYEVGTPIKVVGRVQSREYIKKIDEEHSESRCAYEVSVSKMQVLVEDEVLVK